MLDMTVIYVVVNLLILVVGFFVRQHILDMKADVREIKQQTNITNGRVSVLENETANHKSLLSRLTDKVDQVWKGHGQG